MKQKIKKALRRAYRKGRKDGFDHGFNTAKMIFEAITADAVLKVKDLKQEVEELNTEIIMGKEEEDE